MLEPSPESTLEHAAGHLRRLRVPFALVGGLASSIRGEDLRLITKRGYARGQDLMAKLAELVARRESM